MGLYTLDEGGKRPVLRASDGRGHICALTGAPISTVVFDEGDTPVTTTDKPSTHPCRPQPRPMSDV